MLETAALIWGLANAGTLPEHRATGVTFSVTYRPGPSCPTQAEFEAAIFARAPNAQRSDDPRTAAVRFHADLARAPGQKRRLVVTLDDGSSQDREIEAGDCVEAMQSMALIAAMILSSRTSPLAPRSTSASPERAAPAPTALAPTAPVAPSAEPSSADAPSPRSSFALRPTWLAAGLGVGLEGAAAPSPLFAASVSVELGSVTSGLLAPSLRLSGLFGRAADTTTAVGRARFELALARLHACGLRFGTRHAELRLCAVVEGGALLARGIDARNRRDQTMPWFGVGPGALFGLRVSPRWSVELAGSARRLLVRDEFIFAPFTFVHQPTIFAWDFRLGLAYRAW
jgi:hypothetical protein